MSKFNLGKLFSVDNLKTIAASTIAFGKKNAPALITGGGILMFWGSMYLFWQESKRAERAIEVREIELQSRVNVEEGEDPVSVMKARSELSRKEKFIIYLQYCWLSWAIGIGATGMIALGQKLSIDRLAEMYLLKQVLEDKNEKKDGIIQKLKEKAGVKDDSKAEMEIKEEVRKERYTNEKVEEYRRKALGNGPTLFVDEVTGNAWRGDIIEVTEGIGRFSSMLVDRYDENLSKIRGKKKGKNSVINEPFFSKSDNVWELMEEEKDMIDGMDPNVYGALDVETFMECIGELSCGKRRSCKLGNLLEFRYYGETMESASDKRKCRMPIRASQIMEYDLEYCDPTSGQPTLVWLDYEEFLSETDELRERNPL